MNTKKSNVAAKAGWNGLTRLIPLTLFFVCLFLQGCDGARYKLTAHKIGWSADKGTVTGSVVLICDCQDCDPNTCKATVDEGANVTLTPSPGATPNPATNIKFGGWVVLKKDKDLPCAGGASWVNCGIDMDSDAHAYGTFCLSDGHATANLKINLVGNGGWTSSATALDICGRNCITVDSCKPVVLTPRPDNGSGFRGWSGCSETLGDKCILSMDGNQEVTATFDPLVTLEVEVQGPGKVSGDGINCPDICTVHLPVINGRAPEVSLVAIKDDGAALQSWAGGGCPENDTPTCKVTLNESQVVTATFTDSFKLSVNKINAGSSSGLNSGHGQGTVIAGEYSGDFQNLTSPAINCGGTCESPFHSNAKIAIQAFPGYGSASPYPPSTINWGGACAGTPSNVGTCFITMGAASAEVTVTFGLP